MLKGKELGKAIKEAIDLKKKSGAIKTIRQVAKYFDVKPPSVSGWIKDGSISKDKLPIMWQYFSDVVGPEHWGMTKDQIRYSLQIESSVNSSCKIPQYDTHAAMGNGLILPDQPSVIQSWSVSKDWISKNVKGYQSVNGLCIVTGFGDSMRPLFNPGDPLLVDTSVNTVSFDGIYFFRVDNEGFIKRLQRIPGEGLRVLSENRERYEPWTIKEGMNFQVLGRVLKVWCSEDF